VQITTGFPVTISCDGVAITFFPNKVAKEVKAEAWINFLLLIIVKDLKRPI